MVPATSLTLAAQIVSGHDRARAALWDARNLNMAARLRAATALEPGQRILLIVGVGHKPSLDSYLDQMMDVEVIQLASIIKAACCQAPANSSFT